MATGLVNQLQLVSNFIVSAEFVLKFGNLNNQDFARLMYRNVLLREPSQQEVNFQAGALASGITRAQLASNFLNSNEFRVGTGPRLTAFLLYATLLQRGPTQTELLLRSTQIQNGVPVRTMVDQILASQEFADLLR